jgi:hypothetical protein
MRAIGWCTGNKMIQCHADYTYLTLLSMTCLESSYAPIKLLGYTTCDGLFVWQELRQNTYVSKWPHNISPLILSINGRMLGPMTQAYFRSTIMRHCLRTT